MAWSVTCLNVTPPWFTGAPHARRVSVGHPGAARAETDSIPSAHTLGNIKQQLSQMMQRVPFPRSLDAVSRICVGRAQQLTRPCTRSTLLFIANVDVGICIHRRQTDSASPPKPSASEHHI
eukprot:104073-Rhodomonas_salina.5